jgi:NitT/TauT family transport system ATP-binding protein
MPLELPNGQAAPIVRLTDVGKTYSNGVVALRGLCFSVGAHEFVTLLGPSGCGKSTVLRLIAGLGSISAGNIDWPQEQRVRHFGRRRHDIGFVFQESTLMPWATLFDNVHLPLRLAGQSRKSAHARVEEAIALVGLGGFERAYPRELSGGMKMRVSIARALVTNPRILLMDEPFAALDEITRSKLNNDLLDLWAKRKLSVVFVTHSVFESVYLAERVLVMSTRPGRIAEEIRIPASFKRDEAFRTSGEYNAFCRAASAALHRAMEG